MNYDITFCSKLDCNNLECKRNQSNIEEEIKYIWQGDFKDCKYWEE